VTLDFKVERHCQVNCQACHLCQKVSNYVGLQKVMHRTGYMELLQVGSAEMLLLMSVYAPH